MMVGIQVSNKSDRKTHDATQVENYPSSIMSPVLLNWPCMAPLKSFWTASCRSISENLVQAKTSNAAGESY